MLATTAVLFADWTAALGQETPAGQELTDLKRDYLAERDEEEREGLLETLAERFLPQALDLLLGAVDDPSPEIRKTIIEIVGKEPDSRVREMLRTIIATDPDESVVELAEARLRGQLLEEVRDLFREAERDAIREGEIEHAEEFAAEAEHIAPSLTGWIVPELLDAPILFDVVPVNRPARFVIIGDFGTKKYGPKDRQELVAQVMREYHARERWDFGITVGDNFYPDGLSSANDVRWQRDWENIYGPLGIRFYPAMGNHDWRSGIAGPLEYSSASWQMLGPHYTFRAGSAQLFALDTEDLRKKPEQLEWLERELAASSAPWKIVYGHHPLFSVGRHGGSKKVRELLMPLFERYGVQVYIAGHEHDMQHLERSGIHFFVIGGSGKKPRPLRESSKARFAKSAHGFGIFEVNPERLVTTLVVLPKKLDGDRPSKGAYEYTCTLARTEGSVMAEGC